VEFCTVIQYKAAALVVAAPVCKSSSSRSDIPRQQALRRSNPRVKESEALKIVSPENCY